MKLRQTVAVFCVALMSASIFSGCTGKGSASAGGENGSSMPSSLSSAVSSVPTKEALPMVRVGALQGPTGLGLVELMDKTERKEAGNIYEFTLAGAPDEISGKVVSGELDIAFVPTNLAAALYNKTEGQVRLISVSTLGVLYLLEKTEEEPAEGKEAEPTITSIEDLKGKTVYTTGQGATQEYVLDYLLKQNEVENAEVVFQSEHAELASLMIEGAAELALLPQPFVTTVTTKDRSVAVALDITKEWETAAGGKQLTMGSVIVRQDFLENNKDAVDRFLEELAESVSYVNANVPEAAALSGKYEIIPEAVAQAAIPRCNIVCITGEEMKESVASYLEVLEAANPQSVGGSLPDDAFYYVP